MSRARKIQKPIVNLDEASMLEIIRRPVVTEKSTLGSQHNQVTFRVPLEATKPEIKAAVEGVFKVKVKAVNTLRVEGKTKLWNGRPGKRNDFKKAVVTLVEGNTIDVTTGI
jgi:large subunit ribosomal protein L23